MGITTQKYKRKPFDVDAVRVSSENFLELAFWCKGTIKNNDGSETGQEIAPDRQHIVIPPKHAKNPRQTRAHVGDWILSTPQNGFKVYSHKAFKLAFERVEDENQTQLPVDDSAEFQEKIDALVAQNDDKIAEHVEELKDCVTEGNQNGGFSIGETPVNADMPVPDPVPTETYDGVTAADEEAA
jgi:hypothetical protein